MSGLGKYCKAYLIDDLRKFSGWKIGSGIWSFGRSGSRAAAASSCGAYRSGAMIASFDHDRVCRAKRIYARLVCRVDRRRRRTEVTAVR